MFNQNENALSDVNIQYKDAQNWMNTKVMMKRFNYETKVNSEKNDEENQTAQLPNDPDINISSLDPMNFLNIRLGTNNIRRYYCAAHKINLAVGSQLTQLFHSGACTYIDPDHVKINI
ncbi:unnamed protein product [Brachionus calyciflorus]|uniref:Uncharacterized protein n=1 Tax=Brachionus calyciflorus TaxID=104777 RepID=A0A813VCM3_9BILA|nr:unnamed protein product [Brachionus calyciflorus]